MQPAEECPIAAHDIADMPPSFIVPYFTYHFCLYKMAVTVRMFSRMALTPIPSRRQRATSAPIIRGSGGSSACSHFRAVNDEPCRDGKWRTAIDWTRIKAVLGRLLTARLWSLAAPRKGTQLPAMVTQTSAHGVGGGVLVPWRAPSWRLETF